MESMTGYGESSFTVDNVKMQFRIRSVNNRFLDVQLHFPPGAAWFEPKADELVRKRFKRGRFDIYLESNRDLPADVSINSDILDSYSSLFSEFYHKKKVQIPMDVLANLPGIFNYHVKDLREHENRFEFYFARALLRTQRLRVKEGKQIIQWLKKRIRYLSRVNRRITGLNSQATGANRKRIRKMMAAFIDLELLNTPKGRISATAIARRIMTEYRDELHQYFQTDIAEEVERINYHLPQISDIVKNDGEKGKQIEFYLQELLREVNTLTSKTGVSEISDLGVKMKIEIEKMREQVRNLE